MITYQEESFTEAMEELAPLFVLHWNEVDHLAQDHPLDVNWEAYMQLDEAGILQTVTAREGGTLIGYIINLIAPSMHCANFSRALNDVLFVHPDYRKGNVFMSMLNFTEQKLNEIGVAKLYIHVKIDHDFSPILVRRGYVEIERHFEKQLEEME